MHDDHAYVIPSLETQGLVDFAPVDRTKAQKKHIAYKADLS